MRQHALARPVHRSVSAAVTVARHERAGGAGSAFAAAAVLVTLRRRDTRE